MTRRDTNENPFFAGPFYLHGNSDFLSYNSFFSHLAGKLRRALSHPIFGTDDEKAMKQAMQAAFPDSSLLSCTRHLKQNVDVYLKDKIGVCRKERSSIINSIFGPSGITSADEDVTFDHALKKTEDLIDIFAPSFNRYFQDRVVSLLHSNFITQAKAIGVAPLVNWTTGNNNCESLNAMLKHAVNWKGQPLTTLVLKLYDVVRTQYQDLRRCLAGQGDYILCPTFTPFYVPNDVWSSLPKEKRDNHFKKFIRFIRLIDSRTVFIYGWQISNDRTKWWKKPGQVTRKRSAKTSSVRKRKKMIN